jgi:hypothetical protein
MSLQHVQQQDHRGQWQQPQPRASLAAPAFPTAAAGKEPFPGATLEPFPGSKEPFPGAAALEPFAGSGDSARKNQPPAAARSDRSSAAAAAQGPSVSESRWQTVQVYLFATSSLYGGQLFWLGAWTAVDVDMVVDLGLPESHLRDWLLVVVGFSVLLLLDRWYEEAGIPGSFWFADEKLCGRWELPLPRSTSPAGKLLYILTTVVTLACSTAFWVGIFNLVDDYGPAAVLNSTYAYVSFVAGGFVMMILTGTEKNPSVLSQRFSVVETDHSRKQARDKNLQENSTPNTCRTVFVARRHALRIQRCRVGEGSCHLALFLGTCERFLASHQFDATSTASCFHEEKTCLFRQEKPGEANALIEEATMTNWIACLAPQATHAQESFRALFAIISQVLLWYGVSSLYWVVCLAGSGCSDLPAEW